MKLIEAINFLTFYDEVKSRNTDFTIAYKLAKISRRAEEERTFYVDTLRRILDDYGQKDEQGNLVMDETGNNVKIKPECITDCNKAIQSLADVEVKEMPTLSFEDLKGLSISPELAALVVPFVKS